MTCVMPTNPTLCEPEENVLLGIQYLRMQRERSVNLEASCFTD